MNSFSKQELIKNGYKGFITFRELRNNYMIIPKKNGVYIVLKNKHKNFLPIGTAAWFKNKNPNVDLSTLKNNWIENSDVLYIGKAKDLFKRVKQYSQFGLGKKVGHWGGRYIWQLENSDSLVVCWKEYEEDSRVIEKSLIQSFEKVFERKPFANIQS